MIGGRRTSDHLPNDLIKTARNLFDRLSPNGAPIRYHDFAIRWPEFQREQFPVTFLDCLRRVTPPNGMLTFERFCAGLRLALAEERENQHSKQQTPIFGRQQILASPNHNPKLPTPPLRSVESVEKTRQLMPMYGSTQSMTNGQPPPYNAALSRSRLNLEQDQQQKNLASMKLNALLARSTPQLYEKPVAMNGAVANGQKIPLGPQNAMARNGQHQPNSRPSSVQSTETNGSLEGIKFREKSNVNGQQPVQLRRSQQPKAVANDNRRHTMIEGSETNSSKHGRLLQEEKELLKKAADTAHRLYNWYNERLSSLETREKLVGKSMIPLDFAVHEEKLNYLRAHVTEVNRRAVALMESSDKGFPWHMNLELHRNIPQPSDDQLMWLKRQNKMLTNEVAEKSERIGQLETEKARLIKQLCESPNYKPVIQQAAPYANGSGTDSGFHSLTHQSAPAPAPPLPPPNQHTNGHQRPYQQYTPSNSVVYATPATVNNEPIRYREPIPPAPPQHQRVYAELHRPPVERQPNGVLATLM